MRWSKEKVWDWYNERPWFRGCNYMSADCANRIDQWQSLGFEERFRTTEQELMLMQETGFNTVRLILEFADRLPVSRGQGQDRRLYSG